MSDKKNKTTKTAKKSNVGDDSGPLQVNWIVIGGAILIVGLIVFFSIRQDQANAPTPTPVAAAAGGSGATNGCTPQANPCPPMAIDPAKQYTATVKMATGGEFKIQLHADKAPVTVNSFVYLARQGYFDGLTFHRVLEGFMAQGGDPTGTGGGGPGYQFINEDSDLTFDKAGVVAMANAGRDTNGSQFFITFGPQDFLNGGYTIFGQVTEGLEVVNGITLRDPDTSPTFTGDVMESVTIAEQ